MDDESVSGAKNYCDNHKEYIFGYGGNLPRQQILKKPWQDEENK